MKKVIYLLNKFSERIKYNFQKERIESFGISIAILDTLVFLMHRNDSALEHYLRRVKDRKVQKYIYKNYAKHINNIKIRS